MLWAIFCLAGIVGATVEFERVWEGALASDNE
jgi:hypothetical protein